MLNIKSYDLAAKLLLNDISLKCWPKCAMPTELHIASLRHAKDSKWTPKTRVMHDGSSLTEASESTKSTTTATGSQRVHGTSVALVLLVWCARKTCM